MKKYWIFLFIALILFFIGLHYSNKQRQHLQQNGKFTIGQIIDYDPRAGQLSYDVDAVFLHNDKMFKRRDLIAINTDDFFVGGLSLIHFDTLDFRVVEILPYQVDFTQPLDIKLSYNSQKINRLTGTVVNRNTSHTFQNKRQIIRDFYPGKTDSVIIENNRLKRFLDEEKIQRLPELAAKKTTIGELTPCERGGFSCSEITFSSSSDTLVVQYLNFRTEPKFVSMEGIETWQWFFNEFVSGTPIHFTYKTDSSIYSQEISDIELLNLRD